jgi:hypothetical protein
MSAYNELATRPGRGEVFLGRRFEVFTERHIDRIHKLCQLPEGQRFAMRVVARTSLSTGSGYPTTPSSV